MKMIAEGGFGQVCLVEIFPPVNPGVIKWSNFVTTQKVGFARSRPTEWAFFCVRKNTLLAYRKGVACMYTLNSTGRELTREEAAELFP